MLVIAAAITVTLLALSAVPAPALPNSPALPNGEALTVSDSGSMDWSNLEAGQYPGAAVPADPSWPMTVYVNIASHPDLVPTALAVSDPLSPMYGQHLDLFEAVTAFGAAPSTIQAIDDAVTGVGGSVEFGPSNTYAKLQLTVGQASDLFSLDFVANEVTEQSQPSLICESDGDGVLCVSPAPGVEPTLPQAWEGLVDAAFGFVFTLPAQATPALPPGTGPARPAALGAGGLMGVPAVDDAVQTPASWFRTGTAEGCEAGVAGPMLQVDPSFGADLFLGLAPNQLATAYGYDELAAAGLTGSGVRLAVLEEQGNVVPADLVAHAECFGYPVPDLRQVNVPQGQELPPTGAWVEATLDAQVVAQIAPGLEAFDLYSYNGPSIGGLSWILDMLAMPLDPAIYGSAPPDIVSVSYGWCELAYADSATGILTMAEQLLALAATTPMTYVVSSGDNGSSGCQRLGAPQFVSTQYPASSPWVMSVGGTSLDLNDDNTINAEAVWNDALFPAPISNDAGGGGGSASEVFDRPAWQRGPGVEAGNTRLVPDVASFADSYPGWIVRCTAGCAEGGGYPAGFFTVGGTSASTPQVAAILALITEGARAAGQPSLGFVAPLVYELAQARSDALRDVTVTNNDVNGIGCCDADVGYDLASGWGSVNAAALAVALGDPTVVLTAEGPTPSSPVVVLDASGSSAPTGAIVDYRWDTTGDGVVDTITTEPTLTVPVSLPNPWKFSVTARTVTGRTATASTTVLDPTPAPTPVSPVVAIPRFTG